MLKVKIISIIAIFIELWGINASHARSQFTGLTPNVTSVRKITIASTLCEQKVNKTQAASSLKPVKIIIYGDYHTDPRCIKLSKHLYANRMNHHHYLVMEGYQYQPQEIKQNGFWGLEKNISLTHLHAALPPDSELQRFKTQHANAEDDSSIRFTLALLSTIMKYPESTLGKFLWSHLRITQPLADLREKPREKVLEELQKVLPSPQNTHAWQRLASIYHRLFQRYLTQVEPELLKYSQGKSILESLRRGRHEDLNFVDKILMELRNQMYLDVVKEAVDQGLHDKKDVYLFVGLEHGPFFEKALKQAFAPQFKQGAFQLIKNIPISKATRRANPWLTPLMQKFQTGREENSVVQIKIKSNP